jgi:hypothetical protein
MGRAFQQLILQLERPGNGLGRRDGDRCDRH